MLAAAAAAGDQQLCDVVLEILGVWVLRVLWAAAAAAGNEGSASG